MKKLNQLLPIDCDIAIEGIYSNSKKVKPNSIFFCMDGLSVDGHQYVEEAVYNGAVCVVHSKPIKCKHKDVIYFETSSPIQLLNDVACNFYDYPSKRLQMIGVTGTNGKTIVTSLIYQACMKKIPLGYFGTGHVEYNTTRINYEYTTPEIIFLQDHLDKMARSNLKGACLEVSSIGLSLGRVAGVEFDIAVFTNVNPEHIDFHRTQEDYIDAKMKLFERLGPGALAVVNKDDEAMYNRISSLTAARIITYSLRNKADIRAYNVRLFANKTQFYFTYKEEEYFVSTHLLGEINVYHILAAILVLIELGFSVDEAISSISAIQEVPGRMEWLDLNRGFNVYIDNGNTETHYDKVFSFASKIVGDGRIIAVFGAVGKREYQKRKIIGEIADNFCDHIILTEEDSRDEDPEDICNEIKEGIKQTKSVIITDRETAIYQALEIANKNDVVLIIGKGDETYLIKDGGKVDYIGDKQAVLNSIEEIYGGYDEYEL